MALDLLLCKWYYVWGRAGLGMDEPEERKHLTKTSWSSTLTNKDSGFCILKALVKLWKQKVFGAAVIKKWKYWPKYVDGKAIKKHFAMKEDKYVMQMMSTYGMLDQMGNEEV
jgi:hypothetical protein